MGTRSGAYNEAGCGTCPLTGSFAVKWHCRINGYDPGPSEPSGIAAKWHHVIPVMARAKVEDESVDLKKPNFDRWPYARRSRAAKVHHLRRDRINERMHFLQHLIPNCNKADKASMLDEAIKWRKTLQLQFQIIFFSFYTYYP
ncbi:hypothetical protein IEQ34_010333 [Dendrobium chrysotoxum]|uniref:BHLH domain-containing protein n=1 Tax=Dendrobium chrysotoxum TaxID=161865 RepID=A0AAV7H5E2_DENCH|nr:hypothetical protein IEQ34_010333 [Dendrobium chrysotoxum]